MTTDKPNIRVPRQKRSMEKKERIMEAAMKLFAQKGIHETNSKQIAAEAGVSIGSFYYYFKDKKKLLIEVLADYLDKNFDMIREDGPQWTIDNASELVLYYMKNLMAAYGVAPDFHRQTHVLRYSDPDVKALYDKCSERGVNQICAILEQFKDQIQTKNLKAAGILITSSAENLIHRIKFMGIPDEECLLKEYTDMVTRYLLMHDRR
jgi:AcrR family transcriptional regulator